MIRTPRWPSTWLRRVRTATTPSRPRPWELMTAIASSFFPGLLPDLLSQRHSAGQRPVDVAGGVGRDAFLRRLGSRLWDERGHLAVLCAADANAWCEPGIDLLSRLVIRDV